MPHVGMEYAIMVPVLIMQVILLPLSTGWIMANWTNSRMQVGLQDAANNIGSTIEQMYLSLNRDDVLPGTITKSFNVPTTIESRIYFATGALKTANSTKILNLYFTLQGTATKANTSVTLGPNVAWQSSTFMSNSSAACIRLVKITNVTFPNGAFTLSFG
ncbi:MAG TPA: hypothetical protein VMS95_01590 [Candidatus Krumholzibacteriaceae bacterium]|nr:hypothetical protein [Candidatus Krumholzibacteriaceae bacterium]